MMTKRTDQEDNPEQDEGHPRRIGRREFLQGGAVLAGGAFLAACGGGGSSSGSANTTAPAGAANTTAPVGSAAGSSKPVKFDSTVLWGAFMPTSGTFVSVSAPFITEMQRSLGTINSQGGIMINGKRVGFKVGVYNTQYAAGPAITEYRAFKANGGKYIMGLIAVEDGAAVLGLNERDNIFVGEFVPGTSTQLTANKLRFFFGLDNGALYKPLGTYAYKQMGAHKISSIELDNAWGHGIYETIQKQFQAEGGEWVARQYMQATDTDFTGPLTTMLRPKPDVLAVIIGNGAGQLIVKQARSLGWQGPLVLLGAWDANAVPGTGASNFGTSVGAAGLTSITNSPKIQGIRNQIYSATKQVGDVSLAVPDPISAVVAAMEAAQSTDPHAVMEALPETITKNVGSYIGGWTGAYATKNHGVYVEAPGYLAKLDPKVDFVTSGVWSGIPGAGYGGYPAGTPRSEVPE